MSDLQLLLVLIGLTIPQLIATIMGWAVVIYVLSSKDKTLLSENESNYNTKIKPLNNIDDSISKIKDDSFIKGQEYLWSVVTLSVFKMFKDSEIIDFENYFDLIKEGVVEITSSNDLYKSLTDELVDYTNMTKDEE